MRGLVLISAVCLQLGWSYGLPGASQGVGAYAYQDSSGNRYGGTYGLKDGQVFHTNGDGYAPPFAANVFQDLDDFFPDYFRNLEYMLQQAFNSKEHQKLAYNAARKAFDLTSNQAGGYNPNFASRFTPFNDYSGFFGFGGIPGFDMSGFGGAPNSAFAGAAAAPGMTHQVAAISPANPQNPNIDVTNRFADTQGSGTKPHYYSVSSSSFATSANLNGQQMNRRGAETIVNQDGKVTKYKVEN